MSALVVSGTITNTDTGESLSIAALNITTAADYEQGRTLNITTSEVSVTISTDITDPGYLMVLNLDNQNSVQFGTATTVYWATVLPGYFMLVPLDPSVTTLYFKAAATAANGANVRFKLFNTA